MKINICLFSLGILLALALGVGPVVLASVEKASPEIVLLSTFSCLGWIAVAMLLARHRGILQSVQSASEVIGLSEVNGSVTEVIEHYARESIRYHRASYGIRLESGTTQANLSYNLWRIVQLAYEELGARAVELSLYDEEADLWSQGILIGYPRSYYSQSMLVSEGDVTSASALSACEGGNVLAKPVTFAGTLFGALRVEFYDDYKPTASDRQVLHLLAAQGGIMLVDARFTEEVLRMRRLSEETTRAKTGFLANLSHEIRGPLGIILNGVELSLDGLLGELSEQQRETMKMIKDSGDHLLDLVNDVLDFARLEAGKINVSPNELSLKGLLGDLVSVVRSQASTKNHKLILEDVDPSIGVLCDKRHARQMLINFLTNAVKYTPEDGTITVSGNRIAANRVKISVRDTGIGIPENQRSKVFGAFERVDDKYAMTQMGTGLGMPLTRRLAEVNSGSVGFESKVGEGSTFWVILPAVEIEETESLEVEDEEGKIIPQGHGEVILLVDYEEDSRGMLEKYLSEHGFGILTAGSGAQVLKLLRENDVALVVLENDMPDLPGEEMISAIRSSPSSAGVPIVLLSSRAFVFDIERFLKLGVDRCLSKPVALSEVASTSRRLIDESKSLSPTSE